MAGVLHPCVVNTPPAAGPYHPGWRGHNSQQRSDHHQTLSFLFVSRIQDGAA